MRFRFRILCFLMVLSLLFTSFAAATDDEFPELSSQIAKTAAWLIENVPDPQVSSIGGGWTVFGLSRSGLPVPGGYFDKYYENVCGVLREKDGILSTRKITEYARVFLALSAIGRDPGNCAGYDLTETLRSYDKVAGQGINGVSFSLLALGAVNYKESKEFSEIFRRYSDYILSCELEGGGFSLSGQGAPDVDVTAMVLCALAPFSGQEEVKAAVSRGLDVLSSAQNSSGGFGDPEAATSESISQVLTALAQLGISEKDPRFIKEGHTMLEALMDYSLESGAFSHIPGGQANLMATEQAFYAMVAVQRARDGLSSLYDLKDAPAFSDIAGRSDRPAIEALAASGILNGMGDGSFAPEKTMTRAEFSAVLTRSLSLSPGSVDIFADVPKDQWYAPYIGAAYRSGLIRGVAPGKFSPNGTITVCEAEIMLDRAARYCGLERTERAWFPDERQITRGEAAQKLYQMLNETGLTE